MLELNRIAASKCRQRKKEFVSDVEETKNALETQYRQLLAEVNGLQAEISQMKNQLMSHASCNGPKIDRWIENEAHKFVQNTVRYGQAQTGTPMPT